MSDDASCGRSVAAQSGEPPSVLVHDDRHVRGLWDDRGGDTLLVTFNELGFVPHPTDYWGRTLARRLGVSSLGFTSRARNWHPEAGYADLAPLAERMRARYRRVVLYGFSQGAYAAIRQSGRFGADAVLAFSPQASIDPTTVGGFDRRFERYFVPTLHADMAVRPADVSGEIYLIFDPRTRDAAHARLIAASVPVIEVHVTNIGHETVRAAASTQTMRTLIAALEAPGAAAAIQRTLRQGKKRTFAHLFALADRLARRKRFAPARMLAARAALLKPESPGLAKLQAALDRRLGAQAISPTSAPTAPIATSSSMKRSSTAEG